MLSIYCIIKPPKAGNCSRNEMDTPRIMLSDIALIYSSENTTQRSIKIDKLKNQLDIILKHDQWECEDILPDHDYSKPDVLDTIIYYVSGYFLRKFVDPKSTMYKKCLTCRNSLIKNNEFISSPEAALTNLKSKGKLIHPNHNMFIMFTCLEECFSANANSGEVFEKTVDCFLNKYEIKFSCELHGLDLITTIITYYIQMRKRQYTKIISISNHKTCSNLKKNPN